MPTPQMRHMLGWFELRPARKIDGDHSTDVGNGKARAANKFVLDKPRIEPLKEMLDTRAPTLGERRDLFVGLWSGKSMPLKPRCRVAKSLHSGVKAVPLNAVQPRSYYRSLLGVASHQWRVGMEFLEIPADGKDVCDLCAIVELQNRHHAIRIDRTKRGSELLAAAQIDLYRRHADPLFREKNAYTSWTRGGYTIIQFHHTSDRALAAKDPSKETKQPTCTPNGNDNCCNHEPYGPSAIE